METEGRNASENPTGIETIIARVNIQFNPVATHQKTQQGLKRDKSCGGITH